MFAIEILTLVLTIPGVLLSLFVVREWGPFALKAIKKEKSKTDNADWFMIGVFLAFLGAIPDNVWWGIYWTLRSIGSNGQYWFQGNGIFINLPFRQCALLASAYCHLRAAYIIQGRSIKRLNYIVVAALGIGVFISIIIMAVK